MCQVIYCFYKYGGITMKIGISSRSIKSIGFIISMISSVLLLASIITTDNIRSLFYFLGIGMAVIGIASLLWSQKRKKTGTEQFRGKIQPKISTTIEKLEKRLKALEEKHPSIDVNDIKKLINKADKASIRNAGILLDERERQYENLFAKFREIEKRINLLKDKQPSIIASDIRMMIKDLDEISLNKAEKLLDEREKQYEKFIELQNRTRETEKRIKTLTMQLTDKEITSDAFTKARDDLEREKKEIEEELWKLRSKLFEEEYEKPF